MTRDVAQNRRRKTKSIYAYLRSVTPYYKTQIGEMLADSIFEVEDELESRCGGQPGHPDVLAMNTARNRVLEDLGWAPASASEHTCGRQRRRPRSQLGACAKC